jgi:hypothetical protein
MMVGYDYMIIVAIDVFDGGPVISIQTPTKMILLPLTFFFFFVSRVGQKKYQTDGTQDKNGGEVFFYFQKLKTKTKGDASKLHTVSR